MRVRARVRGRGRGRTRPRLRLRARLRLRGSEARLVRARPAPHSAPRQAAAVGGT